MKPGGIKYFRCDVTQESYHDRCWKEAFLPLFGQHILLASFSEVKIVKPAKKDPKNQATKTMAAGKTAGHLGVNIPWPLRVSLAYPVRTPVLCHKCRLLMRRHQRESERDWRVRIR